MKLGKIMCLSLTVFLVGCSSSSDEIANEFMVYIKNGQHLEMQESLSTQSYQMMAMFYGSISDKVLKPYYRSGQVTDFKVSKISETEKSSRFQVDIRSTSGQLYTDTIDLVKQEGEWKVSKF